MTMRTGAEVPLILDERIGFPFWSPPAHGPARGSVEWLLDAIERHAIAEEDALEQYQHVSQASDDPVVALVMRLILEDEERHHGLLKRIEASLRDALEWTHSPNALPTDDSAHEPVARDLAEEVGFLIEEERTGADYMREMAHKGTGMGAGLDSLLLETMALDSEKHSRMLQFVRDRLIARARRSTTRPGGV